MTDQQPARPPRLQPRRLMVLAGASAAVALAITLYVGNSAGPLASDCPVQAEAAASIDSVAVGELAALNGTGEGRGHASMAFTDPAGTPMSIGDFAGKKLLVNFWASWCVPCREEMPALDALAGRYNSEEFMVLPVNTGETDPAKAEAFLAEGNWPNLPLYAEANSFEIINMLRTSAISAGLPATILLDENGCELAVLQGPAEWDSPDGHNVVEALLGV